MISELASNEETTDPTTEHDPDSSDPPVEAASTEPVEDGCADGYWHWSPDAGGIYLTAWPPRGGKTVPEAVVRQEFSQHGLKQVEWTKVKATLSNPGGERVLVAPPQDVVIGPGRVTVHIASDRMAAFVRVFPASGGKEIDTDAVKQALTDAGVRYGVDDDAVAVAVEEKDPHTPVKIATGKVVKHGTDAEIEYKFRVETKLKPKVLEDGRVDFYELNIVENVSEDQVLAVKTPAEQGEAGKAVTGDELPAKPGKDIQLSAGNNVELSEDGLQLTAKSAGHVAQEGNRVVVYPIYEVRDSVDLATGNIKFIGTVIVGANVTAGTSIKANMDVRVNGNVDGAVIDAGGNVAIRRGIQGQNRTRISSGGDVTAMFVENGGIACSGSVHIGEAIMHTRVTAGRRITVAGRKGLVVGGRLRARDEILANVVGSPLGTITELEVGIDPEIRIEYNRGTAELKEKKRELDQARKNVALFKKMLSAGRTLAPSKQQTYLKLLKEQSTLKRHVSKLTERIKELEQTISGSDHGRIKIKQMIYPGVRITIGYQTLQIRDQLPGGTFHLMDGEIKALSS